MGEKVGNPAIEKRILSFTETWLFSRIELNHNVAAARHARVTHINLK